MAVALFPVLKETIFKGDFTTANFIFSKNNLAIAHQRFNVKKEDSSLIVNSYEKSAAKIT